MLQVLAAIFWIYKAWAEIFKTLKSHQNNMVLEFSDLKCVAFYLYCFYAKFYNNVNQNL